MSVRSYNGQVDADGNLVLPVSEFAPGTRVRVSALLRAETSGVEVLVEASGNELRCMVIDDADAACRELRDVALGTMAFWDNPIDNEIWG